MSVVVFVVLCIAQVPSVDGATLSTAPTRTATEAVSRTATAATDEIGAEPSKEAFSPRDLLELFDFGAPPSLPTPTSEAAGAVEEPAPSPRRPSVLWPALAWAAVLFGMGRWLRTRDMRASLRRALPLMELAAWLAWLGIFSAVALAREQTLALGVLWISAAPPLLAVGRKAAGGLLFWLGTRLPEGAPVEVDGRLGRVRRTFAFELEVETEGGWLVRVPYRSFSERVRVRSRSRLRRIRFDVPLHEHQELRSAQARMTELVLASPWSRLERPVVELEGERTLRVDAAVVDDEAKSLLVSDVRRAWAELKPPALRASSVPRGPSAASS